MSLADKVTATKRIAQFYRAYGGAATVSRALGKVARGLIAPALHTLAHPRDQRVAASPRDLARQMASVGPISLFLHDSDHDYFHQKLELEAALEALEPLGTILSDDADWSYAFLEASAKSRTQPLFLVEPRRVFGILPRISRPR